METIQDNAAIRDAIITAHEMLYPVDPDRRDGAGDAIYDALREIYGEETASLVAWLVRDGLVCYGNS